MIYKGLDFSDSNKCDKTTKIHIEIKNLESKKKKFSSQDPEIYGN